MLQARVLAGVLSGHSVREDADGERGPKNPNAPKCGLPVDRGLPLRYNPAAVQTFMNLSD